MDMLGSFKDGECEKQRYDCDGREVSLDLMLEDRNGMNDDR